MGKVSIIGAGRIGSIAAYAIGQRCIADEVVLVDINQNLAEGQAEDISHSLALSKDTIVRTGDYRDISGSGVVVLACGMAGDSIAKNQAAKKPKGDAISYRMKLLEANACIIRDVAGELRKSAKGAVILTVTSPLDVMNYFVHKITGFPKEKVLGFGNLLDSARFRHVVAKKFKCKNSLVQNAFVIGEHGEGMVPLFSNVKVGGKHVEFSDSDRREMSQEVKAAAWEIISLKGATEFGPSTFVADTVEAILKDKAEIMPVSIVNGACSMGVLARIGKNGAEPVFMGLDSDEEAAFLGAREKISRAISGAGIN